MAKIVHSRHRSRARKPDQNTAPLLRHADAPAQRDLLASIFDAATEDSDLEKYLSQVVAHLGKHSKCSSIGVLLFENEEVTSSVSCHSSAIEFRRVPKASFPGSETCSCNAIAKAGSGTRPSYLTKGGAFFRTSKPDMSARTETPDGPSGLCVGSTFESVALIPITNRKTVMGFILVGDERKDRISPAIVKFLERVGTYVGSTLRNFDSLNKLRQLDHDSPGPEGTIATASHASDEMELVTRLMDAANEPIVVTQDWRIAYVNNKCSEMAGVSKQDMIGLAFLDITHPDDRPAIIERYNRLLGGEWFSHGITARGFDKDGNTRWAELREIPFSWKGRPAIMSLVNDITDRKKAEGELKASEERFRTIIENARDAITVVDENFCVIYESPSLSLVTGYPPEEWVGKSLGDMALHPDDVPLLASRFELLKSQPGLVIEDFLVRYKHRDGSWHVIEASGRNLLHDPRVKGIVVNFRDITERKRAEDTLQQQEQRFRALAENSSDIIVLLNPDGVISYESPGVERLLGLSPEERIGRNPFQRVHPEDLPTAIEAFGELMRDPGGGTRRCEEIRIRHRDGSWRTMEATGTALVHNANIGGVVINLHDITDHKQAAEILQESEKRYRLLAENVSDVIFTSDLSMKLTYVSPSVVQLTGYAPEETMSLNIDGWVAPASREFIMTSFSWALSKAKSGIDLPPALRTATLEMSKKDGGTVWAEIRIDFLRDADGQPTGLLGVARDITDRRIAEMELEHRVQLEMLITEISTAFIGISTNYIDQGIQNALEAISRFTEVDLSYIYTFSADRTRLDLTHEWRSEGTEPLVDRLSSLQVDSIPWLEAKVKQAECVHIHELADLPAAAETEKALFERHGAKSTIVVPMVQASTAIGFLALGSIHSEKTWNQETAILLRLVAEMFANALERKRMDSALRESEKLYRLLAENITDVIWTTDMGLRITYMSPSGVQLVGFSLEEYMNMALEDMLTPSSFERGMGTMAEQQAKVSQQPDGQADHWTLEVELRCKDGSTVWVEEKVTFLRDEKGMPVGLLGATRDISQRKVMEDALRLSEEKYRTLVEASPDGVLSIDGRGVITDCNTGLCRMLGYERDELRGKEARTLGTEKDRDSQAYYRDHLSKGEFLEVETELLRRDGQTLPVWAKLVRLAEPRTADIRTVIYFRDIADRRKIDEMKDEFVGLVSHELRSPLTVIIGALHTAISEGPRLSQRETRQLLEDAALEAEQLSHLVGNLLELSRAQADRLFLHLEPVNLTKAVHKVVESIGRQSSNHKFIVNLPRKLPSVSADQLRLERILYNLLENGVKYSPEGSEITVSAKRDAGHLVVSVSDQGSGISKEDQPKLFKPFQQLGNSMLDPTKGAGLGLLVCRRLVEAHGGRIWVESEPNQGTTFYFTLAESTKNGLDAE